MRHDGQKTRALAELYNVTDCLRPYLDVAISNSGNCSQVLTGEVIDSDSVNNRLGLRGKSVDVVFVTENGFIVFAEMKMDVGSRGQCEKLSSQVIDKISTSRNVLSGKGNFPKYETAYVLLSNSDRIFQQLRSRFQKYFQGSRKRIGVVEVLKESEFEKEFFRD